MSARRNLVFVTGNAKKLKEVQEMVGTNFPFTITNQKIDLPEYQGKADDIAKGKCRLASEKIGGPALTEDTCLSFNALGGLPGPYIKWFLEALGPARLFKLLQGFKDKTAEAICTFAFHNGDPNEEPLLFHGTVLGSIVEPRGESGFGWDSCFEPKGFTKTFGEMNAEEKHEISHRRRAIDALRDYFASKPEADKNGAAAPSPNPSKKRKLEDTERSPSTPEKKKKEVRSPTSSSTEKTK